MLINWFTVCAQALNFLVLVWLMKRFLYTPILRTVEEREKRIAAELADAGKKKAEAETETEAFRRKNSEFDQQRAALFGKAVEDARAEHQRLLDEARKSIDALTARWQEAQRSDARSLNQAIRERTRQEVFSIVRKTLTDLAATSLEERLADVFTRRLREMDAGVKAGLAKALKAAAKPAIIRSAFDLPEAECLRLQSALNRTFEAEIPVQFVTAPELTCGIELIANGQKLAWSIEDYLASLEKSVAELLKRERQP